VRQAIGRIVAPDKADVAPFPDALRDAEDTFTTPRGAARAFRATSSEGAMVFVVRGGEETAPARFLAGKAA
jgi:hypothetical protein